MADESMESSPPPDAAEGGPVKSFLEHLEDLRWTLIKVTSALAVAMIVCLIGGNHLVRFLTYPLHLANQLHAPKPSDTVAVHWGTNIVARFARTNLATVLPESQTNTAAFRVVPRRVGDEVVLSLQPEEQPFINPGQESVLLKNYSPISAFMVAIKLALYGGLVLSLPFIIYFIGQFVLPALKIKERQFVLRALGFGVVLFVVGMAFCYFILMQVALAATVEFSQWLGFAADEWRAEDYISFVSISMLVMGVSFELPIVLLALVKVGILSYRILSKYRPYWVVIELVICAFLTPSGDPFTMVLMALPLHLLYEVSLLIAWYWHWRDARRARRVAGAA
jgi:sec-independent protein translocase protein TatC